MKIVNLGALGDFKNGVNFTRDMMGTGIPVINVKDITDSHRLDVSDLDRVNVQVDDAMFAASDDLFFVRSSVKLQGIGLVGKLKRIAEPTTHCGFVIRFRPNQSLVRSSYLMYLLLSPHYRERLKNVSAGAAIVNVSQSSLKTLDIPLPPIAQQERIAATLTAYDDLIENNQRRMKLLEQAARLLYQEWFVRLKFTGHEHTPIVNGVPQGWERVAISFIAKCFGGGTPSTTVSSFWDGGTISWITPTDVTRNIHFVLLDGAKKITEDGLKNSSAKIVPAHAVLMTSRASVGFFAIAGREVCTNQGFISIVPHDAVHSIFLLLQLHNRVEEIRILASGSTYPEVSRGKFRDFIVTVPPKPLVSLFNENSKPLFQQIRVLKLQNEKLRTARDLLLPRLMSGEIAV